MTAYRLYLSGLDEEDAEIDFPSREAAIAHALWWFLDGYFENETVRPNELDLLEDAERLIAALKSGDEFSCNNFYERVRVVPLPPHDPE